MEPNQDAKKGITSPRPSQQNSKISKLAVTNTTINVIKSRPHDTSNDAAAFNDIDDSLSKLDAFITDVQFSMPATKKDNSFDKGGFLGSSGPQTPSPELSPAPPVPSVPAPQIPPTQPSAPQPTLSSSNNTSQQASTPTPDTNTPPPISTSTSITGSDGNEAAQESVPAPSPMPLRVVSAAMLSEDEDDTDDELTYGSTVIPDIVAKQQQQQGFTSHKFQYVPRPQQKPAAQASPSPQQPKFDAPQVPPPLIISQKQQQQSEPSQKTEQKQESSQVPPLLISKQTEQEQQLEDAQKTENSQQIIQKPESPQQTEQKQEPTQVSSPLAVSQQQQEERQPRHSQETEQKAEGSQQIIQKPESPKQTEQKQESSHASPLLISKQTEQKQESSQSSQTPSPLIVPQQHSQQSEESKQTKQITQQEQKQNDKQHLSPRSKNKTWVDGVVKRSAPVQAPHTEVFRCAPQAPASNEQNGAGETNAVMVPEGTFFEALTGVTEAEFRASPEIHIVRSTEHPAYHLCHRGGFLARKLMAAGPDFEGCTFKVRSSEDGREYMAGSFHMPRLCELKDVALKTPYHPKTEEREEKTKTECILCIDTNIGGDRQDDVDFGHLQTAPENRGCMFQVVTSANALCTINGSAPFNEGTAISSYGLLPEPTRGAAISAISGAITRLYAAHFSPQRPAAEWRQTQQHQLSAVSGSQGIPPLEDVRIPVQKDVEAVFGRRSGGSIEMYRDAPQKVSQVFLVWDDSNGSNSADEKGRVMLRAGYQGAYCAAIAAGAEKLFLTVPTSQAAAAAAFEEIMAAHKEFALGERRNSVREVHVIVSTLDTQALLDFIAVLTKSQIPYKHNERQLK